MGASGIHTFEDDETLGWLDDLIEQTKPFAFFKECLNLEDHDIAYLEYTPCAGVLGTSVMMDALLNGPTKDLPEQAIEWLDSHKSLKVEKLVPAALVIV